MQIYSLRAVFRQKAGIMNDNSANTGNAASGDFLSIEKILGRNSPKNFRELQLQYIIQAGQGFAAAGITADDKLAGAVGWYWNYYQASFDRDALSAATLTIDAYLSLGFLYDLHRDLFDSVLEAAGERRPALYPQHRKPQKEIPVSAAAIRHFLSPWQNSKESGQQISWVIQDILSRIKTERKGFFFYPCRRNGMIFELVLTEEHALLLSADRNKGILLLRKQQPPGSDEERLV